MSWEIFTWLLIFITYIIRAKLIAAPYFKTIHKNETLDYGIKKPHKIRLQNKKKNIILGLLCNSECYSNLFRYIFLLIWGKKIVTVWVNLTRINIFEKKQIAFWIIKFWKWAFFDLKNFYCNNKKSFHFKWFLWQLSDVK